MDKMEFDDIDGIKELGEASETAALCSEDMEAYIRSVKNDLDYRTAMQYKLEEGREEGREEEKIAIAQRLKKMGLGLDIIKKATGFTHEQLLAL